MNRTTVSRIVVIFLSMLLVSGCATGSSIVVGETRVPIAANDVKLFLEAPIRFDVIGMVSASSDSGWTEQGSVDYAVAELKNQAARLGANGVLLDSTGERTSTVIGGVGTNYVYAVPVTAKTVSGRAIFVRE